MRRVRPHLSFSISSQQLAFVCYVLACLFDAFTLRLYCISHLSILILSFGSIPPSRSVRCKLLNVPCSSSARFYLTNYLSHPRHCPGPSPALPHLTLHISCHFPRSSGISILPLPIPDSLNLDSTDSNCCSSLSLRASQSSSGPGSLRTSCRKASQSIVALDFGG